MSKNVFLTDLLRLVFACQPINTNSPEDVAHCTAEILDSNGNMVPLADNLVEFEIVSCNTSYVPFGIRKTSWGGSLIHSTRKPATRKPAK